VAIASSLSQPLEAPLAATWVHSLARGISPFLAPSRGRFDAETNEYVDMMQAGIIDPTKVERVALQNAASIASLRLTTEALITDLPDAEKADPSMAHDEEF